MHVSFTRQSWVASQLTFDILIISQVFDMHLSCSRLCTFTATFMQLTDGIFNISQVNDMHLSCNRVLVSFTFSVVFLQLTHDLFNIPQLPEIELCQLPYIYDIWAVLHYCTCGLYMTCHTPIIHMLCSMKFLHFVLCIIQLISECQKQTWEA